MHGLLTPHEPAIATFALATTLRATLLLAPAALAWAAVALILLARPIAGRIRLASLRRRLARIDSPAILALHSDPPDRAVNCSFVDAQARQVFPHLIPGATYRIDEPAPAPARGPDASRWRDFTVEPGRTAELGDLRVRTAED